MKKKPYKLTEAQTLLGIHLKELGLEIVYEYAFAEGRAWRFDVACPEHRVGFECNGHFQGKHGTGWSTETEKMNTAQALGWRVFAFHNKEVLNGKAKEWVKEKLLSSPT